MTADSALPANIAALLVTAVEGIPVLVASRCNDLRSTQDRPANRALLTAMRTGSGAARSHVRNGDRGMGQLLGLLLGNQDFTADGALLSLGQAVGRAGGCYCGNDLLGMGQLLGLLLSYQSLPETELRTENRSL